MSRIRKLHRRLDYSKIISRCLETVMGSAVYYGVIITWRAHTVDADANAVRINYYRVGRCGRRASQRRPSTNACPVPDERNYYYSNNNNCHTAGTARGNFIKRIPLRRSVLPWAETWSDITLLKRGRSQEFASIPAGLVCVLRSLVALF